MSHSNVKIYVHAILGVKHKSCVIQPVIKDKTYELLAQEMENLSCRIIAMNGMPDHVHILFLLDSKVSIAKVMKQIKGASSYKINQLKLLDFKFAWQIGYGAFSVSKSIVPAVEQFIQNQEQHHKTLSYEEEFEKFNAFHN